MPYRSALFMLCLCILDTPTFWPLRRFGWAMRGGRCMSHVVCVGGVVCFNSRDAYQAEYPVHMQIPWLQVRQQPFCNCDPAFRFYSVTSPFVLIERCNNASDDGGEWWSEAIVKVGDVFGSLLCCCNPWTAARTSGVHDASTPAKPSAGRHIAAARTRMMTCMPMTSPATNTALSFMTAT
jgi:hypothetical protein